MNGSALLGRARCAAASWPERMGISAGPGEAVCGHHCGGDACMLDRGLGW
jgi:hypothetical protein